jgi:hypothetical protein
MKWLVTFACLAATVQAQDPAGGIQGTVRDAINKTPLAGVEVTMSGPTDGADTTDASGGFRFEKLPAGVYVLSLRKPGYLDGRYSRPTDLVRVNSATEAVSIDLTPLSDVEGKILDEDGQPIAGVMIYAGPVGPSNHMSTSDAEGRYRLEALAPADYRIALRVPYETRRKTQKRDPVSGEIYGYANTQHYPGVDDERLATPLSILAGIHLPGVEIRLRRTRLVSLSGRTVEIAGRDAPETAEVELSRIGSTSLSDETYQRRRVGAQGAFQFDLIQPGRYILLVFRGSAKEDLPYSTQVEVGNAGVEDLPVAVPPFPQIRGTVKLSDPKAGWEGSLRFTLHATRGIIRSRAAPVAEDGTFVLDSIPPGQWRIDSQSDGLRQSTAPNRKLHITAIRLGGQDGLWGPLTVTESGNPPIEVTLSDEVGQLAGTVFDDSKAAGGVFVVLRRTDGALNLSQFITPALSKADGSYLVPDVIPGNYEVTVWAPEPSGSTALGPPERCGNKLGKVKIVAGETAVLQLQVCK